MKKIVLIITLAFAPITFAMEPVEEVPAAAQAQAPAQLSVQDLIDRGELPEVGDGILDLSKKGLSSLLGLENIPNPEQVTELRLVENKIVVIPDHAFDRFINLKVLNLVANPIIQIQPNLFEKLIHLEELHLEETNLVEIPPRAFDSLRKLKVLHLFDNKLESLPAGTLQNLYDLEELDIQNNKITVLDPNLFQNQKRIIFLRLQDNRLFQLPKITHLIQLRELEIAGTNITELSPEVIAFIREHRVGIDMPELLGEIPPYSLNQLIADLGDNWIQELVVRDPDTGEVTFNLDNRGLTDLSIQDYVLPQVQKVSARFNYIKRIPYNFFIVPVLEAAGAGHLAARFPNLESIDFSENMIEELSVVKPMPGGTMTLPLKFTTYCPHLTYINFAQNRITQIPKDVFNSLPLLIELQLQDNEISSIADGALSNLRNLTWLHLEHNKLQTIPRNIFKNLPHLQELTIQYNNLGNKEQYLFPPDAQVEFYPQSAPSLKMLVAQKIAESFERKNLLEVYKTLQTIPLEIHKDIRAAASKKVALKIYEVNMIQWLFGLIAKSSVSAHKNLLELQSRDVQEVMLAVAPEELRAQLIQIGYGSALPTGTRGPTRLLRRLAPAEQEESEEEFELMEEPN